MSKGEIIDFEVLRIQNDLDQFQRTKTIPHTLLEGTYDIEEIMNVNYKKLSSKHQKLADKIYKEYLEKIDENIDTLKKAMKKDYARVVKNMATEHESFYFKEIMNLYRPSINPVRALYYQTRDVTRRYNPEHPYHYWLIDLVSDLEFNNIILDALRKDIGKLERIIKRYYFPLVKKTEGVPLEMFHAKQQLKDFRHYYKFFSGVKDWQPDE